MSIISDITKSWLNLEATVLEQYKYNEEGPHRTAGSYILTCTKSLIKLADEDPEMFRVKAMMGLIPIAAAVTIGSAGTIIYFKMKNRKRGDNSIENLLEQLDDEEKEFLQALLKEEKEND